MRLILLTLIINPKYLISVSIILFIYIFDVYFSPNPEIHRLLKKIIVFNLIIY